MLCAPPVRLTVRPLAFCNFTQSSGPGSREAGPVAAVPPPGLLLFQFGMFCHSPLAAFVHSAGTKKSFTNSMFPFAALKSTVKPFGAPLPFCQKAHGFTVGSTLAERVVKFGSHTPYGSG